MQNPEKADMTSKLSSSFCQEGRLGALTPKKSTEVKVKKLDSKSKRSGAVVVEEDQSQCGEYSSSESIMSTTKKQDRGSECSHKVIEKRRRDRINTSLGELSHLLPAQTNIGKPGTGKLEKAEILEITVEYLKSLRSQLTEQQEKEIIKGETTGPDSGNSDNKDTDIKPENHFCGYKDCTEEVFHFLVNVEAMDMQQPCFQRLMAHLRQKIQLHALQSRSDVLSQLGKVSAENGKRAASKRSFQGTTSSSSSTSSSSARERSGSKGQTKRARFQSHHSIGGKGTQSSSSNRNTSNSSDNENSSENSRENQTDSAICLDDDLPEIPGNAEKDVAHNRTKSSMINSGNTNSGEESNNSTSSTPPLSSMLPQGSNMPLRSPFLPPSYAMPTYALHPAGTHFIPVVLHPSVPLPVPTTPAFNGTGQMQFPMIPPVAAAFGMPSHAPSSFGFPFPYVHPGIPPYGYQTPPMGFPCSGLRKDLAGQGTANLSSGNSGSNGDDYSIESQNSSEGIVMQTDSSGNESSNTDEVGS